MSLIRVEHIQLKRCACIQSEVCVCSIEEACDLNVDCESAREARHLWSE